MSRKDRIYCLDQIDNENCDKCFACKILIERELNRTYQINYREKNKEKAKKYHKDYYRNLSYEKKRKIIDYNIEWKKNNPEKWKTYYKTYHKENKEKIAIYQKKYYREFVKPFREKKREENGKNI